MKTIQQLADKAFSSHGNSDAAFEEVAAYLNFYSYEELPSSLADDIADALYAAEEKFGDS